MHACNWIVGLVLFCAAALRMAPLAYGLPFFYHPDETFLIFDLGKFLDGLSRGTPTIGTSTFYYPLMGIYAVYFAYGRVSGRFASLEDFRTALLLDDPMLHLLGRAMSTAFSVGALIAVYALGRRLYGRRGGFVAVVLMSVSLIDISSSHWLKFDSAVAFMSLISVLAILRLKDDPRDCRRYAVAGIIVGLSVAGRIDLLVLVPLLVIAHVLVIRPAGLVNTIGTIFQRPLLVALGGAAIVYVFVSFTLVNMVLEYVIGAPRLFTTREMGASLVEFFLAGDVLGSVRHNIPFYFSIVLIGTCGVPLTAAVATGVARAIDSRRTEELVLLSFVGLATVPMLVFNVYGTHYTLRVMPTLMVLAAGGILWLAGRLERTLGPHGWVLLLAVAVAQSAFYSVQYVRYLITNIDTRARAREWIYEHIPAGERLAIQKIHELPTYVPPITESRAQAEAKLRIIRADGRGSGLAIEAQLANYPSHTYTIVNLSLESYWNQRPDLENQYNLEQLKAVGVDYVITSGLSNPWRPNEDGSPIGIVFAPRVVDQRGLVRYEAFMRELRKSGKVVVEFRPRDPVIVSRVDTPLDPTIRIYSLQQLVSTHLSP